MRRWRRRWRGAIWLLLLTADKMSTREINHKCAPADAGPQKGSRRFLLCVCLRWHIRNFILPPTRGGPRCNQIYWLRLLTVVQTAARVGSCCSQFHPCRPKLTSNNFWRIVNPGAWQAISNLFAQVSYAPNSLMICCFNVHIGVISFTIMVGNCIRGD